MPRVYLSPSLQEYNLYVNGGTEEEITNLIADAMEPYLLASGIEFTRNRPEMSLGEAIAASNEGNYDLHFAIHSNAAPESLAGKLQGLSHHQSKIQHYNRVYLSILSISGTNPRVLLVFLDYMDILPNFHYALYIHKPHYNCKKVSVFHLCIYQIMISFHASPFRLGIILHFY